MLGKRVYLISARCERDGQRILFENRVSASSITEAEKKHKKDAKSHNLHYDLTLRIVTTPEA